MAECRPDRTNGEDKEKLNRNFIGIEIDETYFKIAKERIGEYASKQRRKTCL